MNAIEKCVINVGLTLNDLYDTTCMIQTCLTVYNSEFIQT